MKRTSTFVVVVISAIMAGCGGGNKQSTDDLITVDVMKSYPKKELVLQDFLDVEYIPLETTNEFVTQGRVMAIGRKYIIVRNFIRDGDIFIFDRNGKGVRKFNRMGNSGEDYLYIHGIILDEDNEEIFINDNSLKRIKVYDLYGNFRRNIIHKEDARYDIHNSDKDCFIWWNSSFQYNDTATNMPSFFITSKHDGSIIREIEIPIQQRKSTVLVSKNAETNATYSLSAPNYKSIVPNFGNCILIEVSSDTIYSYLPNHTIKPLIVRTPSIQSMDPEVFLFLNTVTDRFYFMETVKKEFDWLKSDGFPEIDLIYDKQEKAIFEYTIYDNDYLDKKTVNMKSTDAINDEVVVCQTLEAYKLIETYEKGQLKDGRLKEIAAKLDPEDNPVIMLVKHKK